MTSGSNTGQVMVTVGQSGAAGPVAPPPPRNKWAWVAASSSALALLLVLAIVMVRRMGRRDVGVARPRDLFKLPTAVDGFVVVRLLRKLSTTPQAGLADTDRAAMQQDILRVQQAVFAPGAVGLSEGELRQIAGKWLAKLH